jgi:hypothetical protein
LTLFLTHSFSFQGSGDDAGSKSPDANDFDDEDGNGNFFKFSVYCFIHPIFRLWFLITFWDKVTKIQKYYVIFVYILQGKMGKMKKKWKENHATKVTKIPKSKTQKYGMNKTLEPFFLFGTQIKIHFEIESSYLKGFMLI